MLLLRLDGIAAEDRALCAFWAFVNVPITAEQVLGSVLFLSIINYTSFNNIICLCRKKVRGTIQSERTKFARMG